MMFEKDSAVMNQITAFLDVTSYPEELITKICLQMTLPVLLMAGLNF